MRLEAVQKIAEGYGLVFEASVDRVDIESGNVFIVPYSEKSSKALSKYYPDLKVLKFRLLTKSKPRLVVRIDEDTYYERALNFFNPGGLLAQFYLILLRLCGSVKFKLSLGTTDFLVCHGKHRCNNKSAHIIDLTSSDLLAMYIGTGDRSRKLVLYLNSAEFGEIIVKGSTDANSYRAIKSEFDALKLVGIYGLKDYLPEIIEYAEYDKGFNVIISRAVHGDKQSARLKEMLALRFLSELHKQRQASMPTREWLDNITFCNKNYFKDHDKILNHITKQLPELQLGICHGDFSVWNVFIKGEKIKVIDWEEFGTDIILSDLFQYHYSAWLCSSKKIIFVKLRLDKMYKHARNIIDDNFNYIVFIMYFYLWLSSRQVDSRYVDLFRGVIFDKLLINCESEVNAS